MFEEDKWLKKVLDKAAITNRVEKFEEEYREILLRLKLAADVKSEVEVVDSENDPEKFDILITRRICPEQSAAFINVNFRIYPSGTIKYDEGQH